MTFTSYHNNRVSTSNSSTSTLNSDAGYTGTVEDVSEFNTVIVTIRSNVSSATNGVSVEFSSDGATFNYSYTASYTAGQNFRKEFEILDRYMRISYANGGTGQTSFNLNTKLVGTLTKQTVKFDAIGQDAFGRLRVSRPHTIFDASHINGANTYKFTQLLTAGGNGSYVANGSSYSITTSANGDAAIYQTRRRVIYQPGKSLMVIVSAVLNSNSNGSNVTSRIGFFDNNDGYFFSFNNGILALNERTSTSGSAVTTTTNQSSWNKDTINGSGPSGITIDVTKANIYFFDMEWLGVGRVRAGIFYEGLEVICHEFLHANLGMLPYIKTPNLPIRAHINATGANATGAMRLICCTATLKSNIFNHNLSHFNF